MSVDRGACRAKIMTLLQAITTLQQVYDGAPLTTGGLSPVCMVVSDGTDSGPAETMAATQTEHYIFVDVLWLRKGADEASVDTLSAQVFAVLKANRYGNDTWNSMEINGRSIMDYVLLDGKSYRLERIPVVCW